MSNIVWYKLVISIIGCEAAGIIGGIFTAESVKSWFITLNKPSFNPPSWIFAPVWTLLYFLMGVSVYIIWKKSDSQNVKIAITVFIVQLLLNTLWSFIFFGNQNPQLAFIEILLLWIFILISMFVFFPLSRTASYLLVPYLLWVSFAAVLNYSIWRLNP